MKKTQKRVLGFVCLALVALMTIVAYFLPNDAHAADSSTDVIRVKVYNQYPGIKVISPEDGVVTIEPTETVKFEYENAGRVEFKLSYETTNSETGESEVHEITLPTFIPPNLDPQFFIASGEAEITLDFKNGKVIIDDVEYDVPEIQGLSYNEYTLHLESSNPIKTGAEDDISFLYSAVYAEQIGEDEKNNDPIIRVDFGEGISKAEIEIYDEKGNLINKEPIVVKNGQPDFGAGSQNATLPFENYGLDSGKYLINVKAYGAEGELITQPFKITFIINYVKPNAPVIPDTGGFMGSLNIGRTDYLITSVIVFTCAVIAAFVILEKKKKDYRKNIRSGR